MKERIVADYTKKKDKKDFQDQLAIGKRTKMKKIYLNVTSLLCTTRLENIKDQKKEKKQLISMRENGLHAIKCYSFATRKKRNKSRKISICAVPSRRIFLLFFFYSQMQKKLNKNNSQTRFPDLHIQIDQYRKGFFRTFQLFFHSTIPIF